MNKRIMLAGSACVLLLGTAAFAANTQPEAVETPAAPTVSAPAADTSAAVDIDAPATMPEEAIPYSIGIKAVVTEVLRDGDRVSLEVKPEDGEPIVLNLSEETILLDNTQAIPVSVEDIKAGDTIYAYHSMMMTMSIPGQTPALVVLTNLGDGAIASFHMPEQVLETDGKVTALCDNGSIWVSASDETVVTPYRTRQMVTAADIRMGQPFLAWYDVVMESYPAQAVANRIMILPAGFEEQELSLVLDGDMVIDAKMVDGEAVVPARLTAEALGLTVGYRKEDGKGIVTVSNNEAELSVPIGEDAYTMRPKTPNTGALPAPIAYGIAPYTAPYFDDESVTWISAEAFGLLGYDVSIQHNMLNITKR